MKLGLGFRVCKRVRKPKRIKEEEKGRDREETEKVCRVMMVEGNVVQAYFEAMVGKLTR